jgi:hypothetical protein
LPQASRVKFCPHASAPLAAAELPDAIRFRAS